MLRQKLTSSMPQSREDGEEGSSLAAPWRRLDFSPGLNRPRSQPSHMAGTTAFLPAVW